MLSAMFAIAVFATSLSARAADIPSNDFKTTLQTLNLNKGICVILGQSKNVNPKYIMDLALNSKLTFYFQSEKEEEVLAVRKLADATGLLGARMFVDNGSTKEIHITENLADIVIANKENG